MTRPLPRSLEGLIWHLPIGAPEPEWCEHPANCSLSTHVSTVKEAEAMRATRDDLADALPIAFTKADLPRLRRARAQGKTIFELDEEERR
jgi:hypothetical protein